MTVAIQYILTAAQSLALRFTKKLSNDDTWAYLCIILRKRAGIDKKKDFCEGHAERSFQYKRHEASSRGID